MLNTISAMHDQNLAAITGQTIFEIRKSIHQLFSSRELFINFSLQELIYSAPFLDHVFAAKFGCSIENAIKSGKFADQLQAFYLQQTRPLVRLLNPGLANQPDEEFLEAVK